MASLNFDDVSRGTDKKTDAHHMVQHRFPFRGGGNFLLSQKPQKFDVKYVSLLE